MKKINLIASVFVAVFLISACSNDDLSSENNFDKEALIDAIEFDSEMSMEINQNEKSNYYLEREQETEASNYTATVKFRIARKKKDCKKGLGICTIKPADPTVPQLPPSTPGNPLPPPLPPHNPDTNIYYSYIYNGSYGYFMDLPFKEQVPEILTDEDLEFSIDEKITLELKNGQKLYLNPGKISVDWSIGEFGGYQINFSTY